MTLVIRSGLKILVALILFVPGVSLAQNNSDATPRTFSLSPPAGSDFAGNTPPPNANIVISLYDTPNNPTFSAQDISLRLTVNFLPGKRCSFATTDGTETYGLYLTGENFTRFRAFNFNTSCDSFSFNTTTRLPNTLDGIFVDSVLAEIYVEEDDGSDGADVEVLPVLSGED